MPKRLVILIVYSIFLLLLAFSPPVRIPIKSITIGIKLKSHHILAFIPLTPLLWLSAKLYVRSHLGAIAIAIAGAFFFGALVEVIQVFIPYRSGQARDLISNIIGIALGLPIIAALRNKC